MTRIGRWLIDVGDDGWITVYDAKTKATLYTIRVEDVEARTRPGPAVAASPANLPVVYN